MRLSYSSTLMGSCARAFALNKLYHADAEREGPNGHTIFGHAFGAGVAELLLTGGNLDRAIGAAFCRWDWRLEQKPKTLAVLFSALQQVARQFPFVEYEPVMLANGKPAMEVGARLWFDEGMEKDYYALFIDAVLRHRRTGKLTVVEVKSTKYRDDPQVRYSNSPQSVIYSLPLPYFWPGDKQADWDTLYVVAQITNIWRPDIHIFRVEHTYGERLSTLTAIMLEYEYIQRMDELGVWPKSGNCINFGRICPFYVGCDHLLHTSRRKTVEEQNAMDDERTEQVQLDMQIQQLIADELAYQQTSGV